MMNKILLITLLEKLSSKDLNRFEDYLRSPYFCKGTILAEVFSILKKHHFNNRKFSKRDIRLNTQNSEILTTVLNKLSPHKKFNEARIRNIFSKLHKELIRFLGFESFLNSGTDQLKHLLTVINQKHLGNEWEKAIKHYIDGFSSLIDSSFFLNSHIIESYKFNFSYLNKKVKKIDQAKLELGCINNSTAYLFYYFIMEFVSSFITNRTYLHQYNLSQQNSLIEKLVKKGLINELGKVLDKNDRHIFVIEIYSILLEMFISTDNKQLYFQYRNLVFKNISNFSRDEIYFHFINIITYLTINLKNEANESYSKELMEIYKVMLDKEYYINSAINHLPRELYRNILFHGLKMKELKWVNDFIMNYSRKVHPEEIRNLESYGYAYLNYYEGRYSESLKHLNEINTNYFLYKFDLRNLTLRLYYELDYLEETLCQIKAYKEYLRNNKVIASEKNTRYANFIKYYDKFIQLRLNNKFNDIDYLLYLIKKNKSVAFKEWLTGKIIKFLNK